jgi:hypothetical protein
MPCSPFRGPAEPRPGCNSVPGKSGRPVMPAIASVNQSMSGGVLNAATTSQ